MRNYCKFWLTSGHYDDGGGGSIIFTNFFDNESQRELFFESATWFLNPVWNIDSPVWCLLNKRVFGDTLNIAYGPSELSPSMLVPPFFTDFSPRNTWDEENQYFVEAQPYPAWV
jgi:hypothetical protein